MEPAWWTGRFGATVRTWEEGQTMATTRKATTKPAVADTADDRETLALLLMDCTTEFEFPRGQVHAINEGRPHTIRYVLTAEPLRHYPDEWADVTDGPFEVWLDGARLETAALVHATERNRG